MNFDRILLETLQITGIVFVLMCLVELLELKFSDKIRKHLSHRRGGQYLFSSFFGATPGCAGTFVIDTFYMAGMVRFGSIVAATVATCGDEAFVMLANAFKSDSAISLSTVAIIFGVLFVLGIASGYLADIAARVFKIRLSKKCIIEHHEEAKCTGLPALKHFFEEHIWGHIIKKHIPKLLLWLLFSLILLEVLEHSFNLREVITENKFLLLLLAIITGILPISGLNILFLTLFSKGMIPFSILLANSIVQDGHGLLPLLSFSIGDAIRIKFFNIIVGFIVGILLLLIGL